MFDVPNWATANRNAKKLRRDPVRTFELTQKKILLEERSEVEIVPPLNPVQFTSASQTDTS